MNTHVCPEPEYNHDRIESQARLKSGSHCTCIARFMTHSMLAALTLYCAPSHCTALSIFVEWQIRELYVSEQAWSEMLGSWLKERWAVRKLLLDLSLAQVHSSTQHAVVHRIPPSWTDPDWFYANMQQHTSILYQWRRYKLIICSQPHCLSVLIMWLPAAV